MKMKNRIAMMLVAMAVSGSHADISGYTWSDSSSPGGTPYSWIDISSIGTSVPLSDDGESSLFSIGFDFPYYSTTQTQFFVGANGGVCFGSGLVGVVNEDLPSGNVPDMSILPFWDDLNPAAGGLIRYHSDASRLVISWIGVPRFNTSDYQTFQCVLYPDGRIIFHYSDMNGLLTSSTIGIQGSTSGAEFEQVVFDAPYVANDLAVEFVPDDGGTGTGTHYVDLNNGSPVPPYASWATAANNIQDAVDYASDGSVVLVTNGTYSLSSEITVSSAITIESINGPDVTIVDGGNAVRCFNLGSSLCAIDGFTVQNGSTTEYGGGIRCDSTNSIIKDCVVQNNTALLRGGGIYYGTVQDSVIQDNTVAYDASDEFSYGGGLCFSTAENCNIRYNSVFDDASAEGTTAGLAIGGGVYEGILYNCLVLFNHCEAFGVGATADALAYGGGVGGALVINCTIYGNSVEAFSTGGAEVSMGGGAWNVAVQNSIVWGNQSVTDMNLTGSAVNSCVPDAAHGVDGNITNNPNFFDLGNDDFSLAASSPCIDSGSNALNLTTFDLANNLRVAGGTIDMGAFEYPQPNQILTSQESYNNQANYNVAAADDTLDIWNGGASNMAYTITTDVPWLSVVPASGSSTGDVDTITLDFDTVALLPGSYSGQITIMAPDAVNSPKIIPVEMYIDGPILEATVSSMTAQTNMGSSPPDQMFNIYNSGSGSLDFGVSADVSWLSPSPSSGTLDEGDTITLSFLSDSLPAGSHTGLVTVSVGFHSGALPKTIEVVLDVTGPDTHYVDVNNSSPVAPYTSWASAATNIQDAVNYASDGDLVLVTNGTYLLSNEITVSTAITVASVNGSAETIVDGGSATRCFNLGSSLCTIDGFTIQNGSTTEYGAGIRCASKDPIIQNCAVQNNTALLRGGGIYHGTVLDSVIQDNTVAYDASDELSFGGGLCFSAAENCMIQYNSVFDDTAPGGSASALAIGGGVYEGILTNCLVLFNHCEAYSGSASADATAFGGGAGSGTAINCTVYGNNVEAYSTGGTETSDGGGTWNIVVKNSIIWGNLSVSNPNVSGSATHSCTPDVVHGIDGNITNYPDFYDLGSDDFSLAVSSPCIDSGSNALNSTSFDLAGNPRVVGGTIDMGAYEYVNPNQILVSQNFYNGQSDVGISVPDDSLDIWNGGSSIMAYTITTDVPWLAVLPASGSSTGEVDMLTVDYNTASLPAGNHIGYITITAPDAENSPKVIPVDIYIQGAYLELSENSLATGVEQGFSPADLTFDIYNSGIGGMGYSVSTDVTWLSPSPDSGNLVDNFDSDTITLSFDSAALLAGSHTGTVTVSSFHAEGSPKYVEVVLNVAPPPSDPDSDGDGLPDAWEIQYFGSTNHPDANPDADPDADGPGYGGPGRNWAEWIMGTDPTNASSILKLAQPWEIPGEGFVIDWPSVSGRVYTVEWTDSLTNSFQTLETDITHPQNSYTDTVHTAEEGGFYHLKVELEN